MIESLRTPEERFANLPGFPFEPHYVDTLPGFEGLRLHYVDEGPADAREVFFCLHGQPSWCYLYRKMIPLFTAAGKRVIAPDFFGFGRSDKPIDDGAYTFEFHRNTLLALLHVLKLQHITLVCQDWGGMLGLTLPMDEPGRFERLLVMNTDLATGEVALPEGWQAFRRFVAENPDFPIGRMFARACPHLTPYELAAYDAPYPDARYRAGVRRFPAMVPDRMNAPGAEISRRARHWWHWHWRGESFMAIGMTDPVLGPSVMRRLHADIANCPPPLEVADAGHFVQEWGEQVANAALTAFTHPA